MSLKGIRKTDGTAEYIYTDDTLSEENAPGEAKAAGDRIAGVEGRVTTLETAAPEIISNATKDWLDDNVTPTGSAVAIDSSLTQSGLAADAKAAGDAVNDLKSDLEDNLEPYGMYNRYSLGSGFSATAIQTANNNGIEVTILSTKSFMLNGTATGGFSMVLQKKYPVSGTLYMTLKCSDENVRSSFFYYNVGYFDSNNTMHQGLKTLYLGALDVEVVYPDNAVENRDFIYIQPNAVFDNAVFSFEANTKPEPVFVKDINESIDYTKSYSFAPLIAGYKSYIDYDTIANTVTIPRDVVYISKNAKGNNDYKALNISEPIVIQNVNYDTYSSTAVKLVLDTSDWSFKIKAYAEKNNDSERLVATLRLKKGAYSGAIASAFPWSIDGKPYGIDIPPFIYETDSVVKTIGHRGWHTAPENTIPAFKEARKNGCLRVETDVQFTASGTPVLLHDDTLNRTCCNASDGSSLGDTPVYISALTDAELENYDACTPSKWDTFNGTKIPTLEEFCKLCRDIGLKPDIELKTNANLNEQKIQNIIGIVAKYGLTNVTRYPSESETYLTHVKNNSPTSSLELIVFDTVTDANITTMQGLKNDTNKVYVSLYAQSGSVPTDTDVNKCIAAGIPMEASGVIAESANGIRNANPYISAFCNGSLLASNILYNNGINT